MKSRGDVAAHDPSAALRASAGSFVRRKTPPQAQDAAAGISFWRGMIGCSTVSTQRVSKMGS